MSLRYSRMTAEGGGTSRTPLEALITALRHSRAAHLTGSTVLRQVLGGSYRELWRDGKFDLTPVWDLLAAQPKFEAAEVMPAFAKLKSWESKLGKSILLPPLMEHLTESELAEMAASIHVPATELAHVLRGGIVKTDHVETLEHLEPERRDTPRMRKLGRDSKAPPAGPPREQPRADSTPPKRKLTPAQRKRWTIVASAVAALTAGFVAFTLFRSCEGRSWDQVTLEFAGDIPLASAEHSGPEVAGNLRDDRWLKLPDKQRRQQMTAALRDLPPGVEVFFVRDRAGKVRASARWFGSKPRQIAVTLR